MANDALGNAFTISVIVEMVDKFTGYADNIIQKLDQMGQVSDATQKRIEALQSTFKLGAGLTAMGAAGAYAMDKMVMSAGKLQTAMKGVQYSMGLTNEQTAKLTNTAMTVGIPTVFSAQQVSGIAAAMSRGGIPNYASLQKLLPLYTNFADVQSQLKHENEQTSTSTATTMAHAYQLYTSQQLAPFLNTLNAMLLHSNETVSEVGTEWKYASGAERLLGMSPGSALTSIAFMNRMGLGNGRGGMDLQDFLQHLVPGAQGGTMSIAAMQAAGFVNNQGKSVFLDSKGQFKGWQNTINVLNQFADKMHHNVALMLPILESVFGQAGGQVASRLVSGNAGQLLNITQGQIQHTSSINTLQKQMNMTVLGQAKQLGSTVNDIFVAMANNGMINPLTQILHIINQILHSFLTLVQHSKALDFMINSFITLATVIGLTVGPMLMLGAAWRAFKLLMGVSTGLELMQEYLIGAATKAGILYRGLQDLAVGGARVAGIIVRAFASMNAAVMTFDIASLANPIGIIIAACFALGAAIGTVYALWTTDWDHIQEHTKQDLHAITNLFGSFVKYIENMFKPLIIIMRQDGHTLMHMFGLGIKDGTPHLTKATQDAAQKVADNLQLHSPAKEGPLSTLDTWWSALFPTLLQGVNLGQLDRFMSAAGNDIRTSLFGKNNGSPMDKLFSSGRTNSEHSATQQPVEVTVVVRFESGSIVTSDPRQAGQQVVSALKGRAGYELGKELAQLTRSSGKLVSPNAI